MIPHERLIALRDLAEPFPAMTDSELEEIIGMAASAQEREAVLLGKVQELQRYLANRIHVDRPVMQYDGQEGYIQVSRLYCNLCGEEMGKEHKAFCPYPELLRPIETCGPNANGRIQE
jgi:hypothetical protein